MKGQGTEAHCNTQSTLNFLAEKEFENGADV